MTTTSTSPTSSSSPILDGVPTGEALDVLPADLGPGVRAGFTGRSGGVSTGPYRGLNLGGRVGDDPAAVARNRERLQAWAGVPVRFVRQVHGTGVVVVDLDAGQDEDEDGEPEIEADAVVVPGSGQAAGVLVADCLPVLLADPAAGVVAAAHAGRRGLVAGVLRSVVGAMSGAGARPERIRAVIGPAAGPCCYEVPEAMRAEVSAELPAAWSSTTWGTPSLDLRAGAVQALEGLGVTGVLLAGGCTIEDGTRYSYRRSATTGRFAGVVRLLP